MPASKRAYQEAMLSQGASNLSAIVDSFSRILTEEIWPEAREKGEWIDYVNKHPISRLFAEQIAHLSGAGITFDQESYHKAYLAVRKAIEAMEADKK